jgi:hypothetical protein
VLGSLDTLGATNTSVRASDGLAGTAAGALLIPISTHIIITPHQVRRRKESVLTQLPPKQRRTVVVRVDAAAAQGLSQLRRELRQADGQWLLACPVLPVVCTTVLPVQARYYYSPGMSYAFLGWLSSHALVCLCVFGGGGAHRLCGLLVGEHEEAW